MLLDCLVDDVLSCQKLRDRKVLPCLFNSGVHDATADYRVAAVSRRQCAHVLKVLCLAHNLTLLMAS